MSTENKTTLVNQPTKAPIRKIKAVGISGLIIPFVTSVATVLIVRALPGLPEESVTEIATAAAVLVAGLVQGAVTFISGYMTRNKET